MDKENEDRQNKEPEKDSRESNNNSGNDKKNDGGGYWSGNKGNNNANNSQKKGSPNGPKFDFNGKNRLALGFFVFLIVTFLIMLFNDGSQMGLQEVPYSTFIQYVESNQVNSAEIRDERFITFNLRNNVSATTRIPYDDDTLMEVLKIIMYK